MILKERILEDLKFVGRMKLSGQNMARKYLVSRQAIQQAMNQLEKEKRITIQRGVDDIVGNKVNIYTYNEKGNMQYKGASGMDRKSIETKKGMFKSKVDNKWYNNSERYGHSSLTKKQAKERYYKRGDRDEG